MCSSSFRTKADRGLSCDEFDDNLPHIYPLGGALCPRRTLEGVVRCCSRNIDCLSGFRFLQKVAT